MKRRPGPPTDRERLNVLGKYLDDALSLADMSQSDLAKEAGLHSSSYVSKVMKEERPVDRETLLRWCSILRCPDWLEALILNAALHASRQQEEFVNSEEVIEETHQRVVEEIEKRRRESKEP